MILNIQEVADILGYENIEDCPIGKVNIILPAVDDYIKSATGKDWATDTKIDATAKFVASVLFVRWFEDPGMIGKVNDLSIIGLITQLHAKALSGDVV